MKIIEKNNSIFEVDIEETKKYYCSNMLCDCCCCRNLYVQIKNVAPNLGAFLAEFGVDICRPDEAMSLEQEESIEYLLIAYSVVGKVKSKKGYQICIDGLEVQIGNEEGFPCEQFAPHFFITVSGLNLPWVLTETFPK